MRFFAFPAPAQALLAALVLIPAAAGAVTINFDTYPGGGLVPPGFTCSTLRPSWASGASGTSPGCSLSETSPIRRSEVG